MAQAAGIKLYDGSPLPPSERGGLGGRYEAQQRRVQPPLLGWLMVPGAPALQRPKYTVVGRTYIRTYIYIHTYKTDTEREI